MIAIWREFILKGEELLDNYIELLKLGYTKSISKIYETAGIKFDFSIICKGTKVEFIKIELSKID